RSSVRTAELQRRVAVVGVREALHARLVLAGTSAHTHRLEGVGNGGLAAEVRAPQVSAGHRDAELNVRVVQEIHIYLQLGRDVRVRSVRYPLVRARAGIGLATNRRARRRGPLDRELERAAGSADDADTGAAVEAAVSAVVDGLT